MQSLRTKLEKIHSLVRQGFNKEALKEIDRLIHNFPREDINTDDEITIELEIPTEYPSIEIEEVEGVPTLVIDRDNLWYIPEDIQKYLQESISNSESYTVVDWNIEKMGITAKLKELVLQEKIKKVF